MTTPRRPKVVLWDIETTHNLVAKFNLSEEYVNHENIVQERYIVCASWKELDRPKVESVSVLDDKKRFKKDHTDDKAVVKALHEVLMEADVIVAHNGDQYDIKFTEGRMLFHGLPPLPPIMKIDTLQTARSRFLLNSNRLDYLARYMGIGHKKPTKGGLWLEVIKGSKDAVREMVEYNKHDVVLLEKVFKRLTPYMSNLVNLNLYGQVEGCPRCGSLETPLKTIHRSTTNLYTRYQCPSCFGWYRDRKALPVKTTKRIL